MTSEGASVWTQFSGQYHAAVANGVRQLQNPFGGVNCHLAESLGLRRERQSEMQHMERTVYEPLLQDCGKYQVKNIDSEFTMDHKRE
jgi:hypothetical protein